MFCILKKKKTYPVYVSLHNCEKRSYCSNISQQRKVAVRKKEVRKSCSQKTISVIKDRLTDI